MRETVDICKRNSITLIMQMIKVLCLWPIIGNFVFLFPAARRGRVEETTVEADAAPRGTRERPG